MKFSQEKHIVFIDSAVEDRTMLSEALRQRARIVVLPAQCDGLAQIAAVMAALLLGGQARMAPQDGVGHRLFALGRPGSVDQGAFAPAPGLPSVR